MNVAALGNDWGGLTRTASEQTSGSAPGELDEHAGAVLTRTGASGAMARVAADGAALACQCDCAEGGMALSWHWELPQT
jgi:hypothetical protein